MTDATRQAQAKRYSMEAMLATGYVKVGLVPSRDGVVIPLGITGETLVLDYGDSMTLPPTELVLSDEGVAATMFINHVESRTFVPWDAVYCIASNHGHMAWPEDAPVSMAEPEIDDEPLVRTPPRRTRPEWLSLVN